MTANIPKINPKLVDSEWINKETLLQIDKPYRRKFTTFMNKKMVSKLKDHRDINRKTKDKRNRKKFSHRKLSLENWVSDY